MTWMPTPATTWATAPQSMLIAVRGPTQTTHVKMGGGRLIGCGLSRRRLHMLCRALALHWIRGSKPVNREDILQHTEIVEPAGEDYLILAHNDIEKLVKGA